MKWSEEALSALSNVPFFVRKKVRKKVETFVTQKGKLTVDLSDVNALKAKFLSKGGMEKEIKGYEVSTCFGGSGCPNVANSGTRLARDIEAILEKENILDFLKATVKGDLKFHHEFRVAVSDCANACSRPQIVDIGIIGAVRPGMGVEPCTGCGACVDVCDEKAITLDKKNVLPTIDHAHCLLCAKCIRICPSGTLFEETSGFRVMLGGRLGRHPRLAMEIEGIFDHQGVLQIVKNCITFYKSHSKNGQRFAHLFSCLDPFVRNLPTA